MSVDLQSQTLPMLLRLLKLPAFAAHHEEEARKAETQGVAHTAYLRHLVELELSARRGRRIERLQRASDLPSEKGAALWRRLISSGCRSLDSPQRALAYG